MATTDRSWRQLRRFVLVAAVLTFALILCASRALAAPAVAATANPAVAPVKSQPNGHSYGEWSAAWWQWAEATPTSVNPVLDRTGAQCAQGQTGHVWFLAGSFGTDVLNRSCTI